MYTGNKFVDEPPTSRTGVELADQLLDKGCTANLDTCDTTPDLVNYVSKKWTALGLWN
jgi:hypothetical protein